MKIDEINIGDDVVILDVVCKHYAGEEHINKPLTVTSKVWADNKLFTSSFDWFASEVKLIITPETHPEYYL